MTAVIIENEDIYVGHVGDTRAYLISEEEITQITKDHSLVQQMVDNGEITEDQARNHPQKNVITRVVGYYVDVDVDVITLKWKKNDRILVCCDGLTTHVEDFEIKDIILSSSTPQEACAALIETANKRGGRDNISAIVTPPLGSIFKEKN